MRRRSRDPRRYQDPVRTISPPLRTRRPYHEHDAQTQQRRRHHSPPNTRGLVPQTPFRCSMHPTHDVWAPSLVMWEHESQRWFDETARRKRRVWWNERDERRRHKVPPPLPSGWCEVEAMGRVVRGSRLIPVKTPLTHTFRPVHPFTPRDLLHELVDQGTPVGLVVDLTNTDRYYDPKEFGLNVEHHKIRVPGHDGPPTEEMVHDFVQRIDRFVKATANSFCVVHCTHGYNRTGFMIVAFLLRTLGLTEALARFVSRTVHVGTEWISDVGIQCPG
eukprot:TRINITY_DN19397_c0_g1_i1.p2 TRINITY_DN19397_c0_g1~~TRINITY_DN19397_c0_g1_i1.p2  ORF type:complete len:291 (+),score=40.95 TRINITY_DN19397_c0_g1_i1:50-874(+)